MSRPPLWLAALAVLALLAPLRAADAVAVEVAPAATGVVRAPDAHDAAARRAVAGLTRATTVNDRDGNKVFDDLDAAFSAASPGARLDVIVSFVDGTVTDEGLRLVRRVAPGAQVARAFTLIPAYAGSLSRTEALRVAALDAVRQIEADAPGTPELDTATAVMGAEAVVEERGITGSLDGLPDTATTDDVGIAVLDSGFHTDHVDLAGKLVAWKDLGTGRAEPYDTSGHGTHVASIAAGWGRGDPAMRGVAPGASLIGIKIDGGGATSSNAIAGYEWIVEEREALGVRVATISYGFGTATDGTTALERAIDATWDAGIVTFKSNGNSGPDFGTMTVPAAARGILAIGSMLDPLGSGTSKYGFALSWYSSRGPTSDGRVKPDLAAPGESIRAANTGTTQGYTVKSGTSMAAPFAAGTAALMIAANPGLQPDDVRKLLFATAEDRGAPGPDNDFGHGRIQVWDAVAAASEAAGEDHPGPLPRPVPDHHAATGPAGTGVFSTTFTVEETDHPVAITALSDTTMAAVEVTDPDGELATSPVQALNLPPLGYTNPVLRQHDVSFRPTATGTYQVRVIAPPGSTITLDVSHG